MIVWKMSIDAKESCAIIWRIIGFSTTTSIKFMRNHPILSVVSIFLLVLYILLPSLLFFMIYSSPVLACAVVYAREKLGLRFSGSHQPLSSSGPNSCGEEKSGIRCHLTQQRSVRRNARMKVEEWDSQTSEEEKDKVILTSLYNDLLGRTPHFEESPKAIETNVLEEDNDKVFGEEDSRMSSRHLGYLEVEEPIVCNGEINGELDGKEEMRNEYGISEIDRNKRLESLIARRRTRRLFKLALDQRNRLQAEEATSPTQNNNLQITVPRNNNNTTFEKRRNYPSDSTIMGLQVPSSAPSVMVQGRNPFDIPYDPQEERPNLTGDSFDQEFSFFNHKDMFFCRHESFRRVALFSPEHAQCMNSPISASDISTTRKRLDLDNEYMDHTEQKLPCYGRQATIEDDDKCIESRENGDREVEVSDETDSNKEDDDDSSCSEESESELNRLTKAELREAISHSMDNYPGFLVNQTRNVIPSPLPKGLVAPRLDDNNMFYARRCRNSHSRTFSIASDMQVEVSEIGSPPTTVDWLDDCSNGGESYTYDTDIDKEIICVEESRKRVSSQCELRSGIGSKEENNGLGTKPVAKPDQKCLLDEHLGTADMDLPDRRSQTEESFEQRPSSSSDVSKPTSYGKFEDLLFHTSVSLSSITEEPETILDSIGGRNSENMKCLTKELTDQISLTSMDSFTKKLIDEEVVDVQQLENDDLCGSHMIMDSNIIDHQQKDQILENIQGEYDTEIHIKKCENTKLREYEATQSFVDASFDTPYIESFKGEIKEEEEEPNFDNFTKEVTKQTEDKTLQGDLKSFPCYDLTKLLESEIMEKNGQELVKNTDENAKPVEQEKTHDILEASSSHPHTQLVEDYGNAENDSDVILLHVQDGNYLTLNESTDQEFSKEEESSGLSKDFHAEYNNVANVEEESTVSEDTHNSKGSQPRTQQRGIYSSEGISPRTLEITQHPEHDDATSPNTVSHDMAKDKFAAAAKDSTATEKNNEENMKHNEQVTEEAVETKLELNLQSMHHNTGLTASEDDEESNKVIGAVHNAETKTTKTETES